LPANLDQPSDSSSIWPVFLIFSDAQNPVVIGDLLKQRPLIGPQTPRLGILVEIIFGDTETVKFIEQLLSFRPNLFDSQIMAGACHKRSPLGALLVTFDMATLQGKP